MTELTGTTSLVAQVLEIEPIDLLEAFGRACGEASCAYRRGPDGAELLSLGQACASRSDGAFARRFSDLRERLGGVRGAKGELTLFGWTAFADHWLSDRGMVHGGSANALPGWEAFSRRALFVPEVTLRRRAGRTEAVVLAPEGGVDEVWQRWKQRLVIAPDDARHGVAAPAPNPFDVSWLDQDQFRAGVREVTDEHIAPKVVLARRALVHAESPIDPAPVLRNLSRTYPTCSVFALSPNADTPYPLFIGATPETLAQVEDGRVETMALAGTAQSGEGERPDEAADAALLESTKDLEEHRFVLDMITEALAPLCDEVAAEDTPRLHRLANVSHLLTHISGTLAKGKGLADVVDALHPTPAVCGTPRELARELIGELEGFDRGLYAGALGFMDIDGNGVFDVAIRCGLIDERDALIYAGAGITEASDVDVELTETRNKFEPLLNAIGEVNG